MDDLEPFESPKLLVDGAKASIDDFESLCKAFVESCTYDVIQHTDPKTGEQVVKLRFHKRVPPKIRLTGSHAVNDLRHALDQAVVHAAVMLGRISKKGVQFPFGKTEKDLDAEINNRCKGVDADIRRFIRSFKPYYAGDRLLYELGALSGPNKHQDIIRISLDSSGVAIGGAGVPWLLSIGAGPSTFGLNKWNSLRNELEFIRVSKGTAGNIDARPVLQIVLGTGEPPLSGPAATVLRAIASKVETIILGIEAEARMLLSLRA